ncbi:MFS transporter [Adlercreutzia faecimuris]|uniref:MFS transporter n=1 Tax=Adlercreutzia faecimuris TaxID=2897341 RepID=A0ABS9WIJ4_9ACTN|nr:MFS transporter [Adlercreutzia sp. JBNU-10]MCI2242355.1 MFS transporter [Adlercreutzia sp. JBNU-10]
MGASTQKDPKAGGKAAPARPVTPAGAGGAPPLTRRQANAMTAVIIATMFCNGFMITLMSVALPGVAREFHVTVAQANWVILVFTIVGATLIAMGARLLHRWGIRVIMGLATGLMAAGGLVGLLAQDYGMVMAARVLQASAAGLLFPTASTCLIKIAPPGRRAFNLSLFTACGGVGFAISPFVSGLLLTRFGVNAVFAPTVVAGAACCVASLLVMRPIGERRPDAASVDLPSIPLIFAGMGALMFGISEINHQLPVALALIAAGVAVTGLFAWRQRRLAVPLLSLRPLADRAFVIGIMLLMFGSLAEHAVRLTLPLYLEGAAGFTASDAGLFMLLPQLAYSAVALLGGKLTDKHGIWPVVPIGFAVITAGFAVVLGASGPLLLVPLMIAVVFILGGVGVENSSNRAAALESLDAEHLAAGASIASVSIQLASSLSSALLVGTMSNEVAANVHAGMAEAAAYAGAFGHTVVIMIVIEAVMLAVSLAYAWRRRDASRPHPAPAKA